MHYHLGNREDVLRELLAWHVPEIADRRLELLDKASAQPAADVRSAAEAIVRPITEFAQRGWRERCYLQIGSELTNVLDRTTPEIREPSTHTAGYTAWDLLRDRCPAVPDDLWFERREICIAFIGRARGIGRESRPARQSSGVDR